MKRRARFLILSAVILSALAFAHPSWAQMASGWLDMGDSPAHASYAGDPAVSATGGPSTGIAWMANLYSADLGSPAIAYNAVLGTTVAYVGNERGDVIAVNASNGEPIWSVNVGLNDSMRDTPAIAPDGTVWIGTHYDPTMYKLNGATGAIECSSKAPFGIDGSPIVATPPGGPTSVYYQVVDGNPVPGPIIALNEKNCATIFTFKNYIGLGGGWTTPAFGVDAKREPLVLTGDADPDETMYAIDALTGKRVWYFRTAPNQHGQDYDIGSAATVSAPGSNGFADGVLYLNNKAGYEWALDLTTGAVIWKYNMFPKGGHIDARSGTALDRNFIVFGNQGGVQALNATTGALLWSYSTPLEVISSPAIIGPAGNEVVAFGDIMGQFHLLALANGSPLYTHQTGGYISSSPAEANGQMLIASSDGFLYSFMLHGSNAAPPTAAVTSPVNQSQIVNPNGTLTVTGTASDKAGVGAVEIALQSNGPSGPWYNSKTGTYGNAPTRNAAILASPGAPSSTWSYTFPAPAAGGTFAIVANAVNIGHVASTNATSAFTILPSRTEAVLSAPITIAPPGGGFEVTGHGFGIDDTVAFRLFGKTVATVKTRRGTGNVPTTLIAVPTTAAFGPTSILAVGLKSHLMSSLGVLITNAWTQLGGGPARVGYEPFDEIITKSVGFGKNTVLAEAWDYATGAPINSSPAIFDGVAYIGNDLGVLSAVVTNTGAPKWTYNIASAAPIRSSPAVDDAGNIIFGANDGNLYMLNPGGVLTSTVLLGGDLSSPAVANHQTYIASSTGGLYDVREPNGTVAWKAQLSAPVSAPAYDAAAGVVVVGDQSGAVSAFNATTGAQTWKVTTGGAITASPAIASGVVYIGSGDSTFYAIDENTGARKWKFSADSPIVGGAAVFPTGEISFGSQKGTLYQLSSNGAKIYAQASSFFENSAIVGLAAVDRNVATQTAHGQAALTRNLPPELPWKFQSGAGLTSSPAINDGVLYIGAGDGGLYAFTPEGRLPPAAKLRRARSTMH